jgi:histidinol-phosphate aminotransferase
LAHREVLDQQTEQICEDREKLMMALEAVEGIKTYPSRANFILFCVNKEGAASTGEKSASEVFESLKTQGVLIKNLSPAGGVLQDCLRVTVGSPKQNEAFLSALMNSLD